ncbi:hypothetical protein GGQ84_003050 [Desulfitispora alkaliphila]
MLEVPSDFVNSTAAARANGYVAGFCSDKLFKNEFKKLTLPQENRKNY